MWLDCLQISIESILEGPLGTATSKTLYLVHRCFLLLPLFYVWAYSGTHFDSFVMERQSLTDYSAFLGYSIFPWRVKKQNIVHNQQSTDRGNYRAMTDIHVEVIWIQHLLVNMGVCFPTPTFLYCDN